MAGRGLGLGQYEAAFRENEIDADVLSDLTEIDLEKLGLPLGHRKRLLKAIANLTARVDLAGPSSPARLQAAQDTPRPAPETLAERRQVTVMFSDLVGSTTLAGRMDPEDLHEVISAYQKCVAATVRRFGGFVAKYMGDGVLVYFGYPQAHEDDAERAVRAGLDLVAAVTALKTQASLQTRVGIATGVVVVGDLVGSGEAQERGIVGETPNLAARLQGIAEPNTVVIAESTRKLLGSLFELHHLGAKDLKGIGEPVRTWAVLRPGAVESRFDALHTGGLTELVGREEELELLLRRWSKAKTGEGQVVLLSGEAGIGKSRLTAALLERLTSEPHTRLRYFCSPQHTGSALYPVISQMERAAGFARDDTEHTKLNKLDAVLALAATSIEDATLFAEMLSLSNDGRYPVLQLAPLQRRQRTLEALASQVAALTGQNPVVAIFEDAQWADPTSLEAFGRVVDRVRSLRVLLVVTFRPDFEPPWVGRPYVTFFAINRLRERDISAMIGSVVGNKLLPANIRQDIIERTDGIPLFVEEMTKAVLEAGSENAAQRTAASIPLSAPAVPASLQASLMARLDRLGPAREIAQIGSAIGREFSHALLAAVVGKPKVELASALDRLIVAGLLFQFGVPPDASYLFKHALVQDAAYSTLLRSRRQQLHGRIATTLESQFPEIAVGQPEIVARHYTEAVLSDAAIDWWSKAGELALRRSAFAEAVVHLDRAIGLAEGLVDNPAHRLRKLRLQTVYAQALVHARGQGAAETNAAFARARELASGVDNPAERFPAYYGLWTGAYNRADLASMRELAQRFQFDAERWPGSPELGIAHRVFGITCWFEGDFLGAREHLASALSNYDHERDRHMVTGYAWDPGIPAMFYFALATWALGDVRHAVYQIDEALRVAAKGGHVPTLAYAHVCAAVFAAIHRNSGPAVAQHAETVIALARKHVLPQFVAIGTSLLGWAHWSSGSRPGEGEMRDGLALMRAGGIRTFETFFGILLAELESSSGQTEASFATLNAQLALIEQTGQRSFEAAAHRLRGELMFKLNPPDVAAAEQAFTKSIVIARNQQTPIFELRAAMSMARLWRDQGKREEARDLLAPVYSWFTEGFDTRDLKEAKALLDTLTS